MSTSIDIEKDRKLTKKRAWAATIIYSLLFPFLFMFAAASIMIFDSPRACQSLLAYSYILVFLQPLSIPFTFYLIWSRYSQGDYKKSRMFYFIPLYIAVALDCQLFFS